MTTWVALLRGINVGGARKVPMSGLRDLAGSIGLDDVATYIQSGNMVFDSTRERSEISRDLEDAIGDRFGFGVPVCLRDAREFQSIATEHPFRGDEDDDRFLVVAFLDRTPEGDLADLLPPERYEPERYRASGTELFLHYPNGTGRAKLSNDVIERSLETRSTMRNWRTVQKIAALADR